MGTETHFPALPLETRALERIKFLSAQDFVLLRHIVTGGGTHE